MQSSVLSGARDLRELSVITSFVATHKERYLKTGRVAGFYVLIRAWNLIRNPYEVGLISELLVSGILDWLSDRALAREVLHFVGSSLCTCEPTLQWQAASKFLDKKELLSVQLEAAKALSRLEQRSPNVGAIVVPGWKNEMELFVRENQRVPEVKDLAVMIA